MRKILIIDEDEVWTQNLRRDLTQRGYEAVRSLETGVVNDLLDREEISGILLNPRLSQLDAKELVRRIKTRAREIPVILVNGQNAPGPLDRELKEQVFCWLQKPIDQDNLILLLEKAIQESSLYESLSDVKECLKEVTDLEDFMLSSENVQKAVVHGLVRSVSKTDVNVLLAGESGTGKELTARVIHQLSNRRNGPFVAVDCASIPETLIESELFGHEKGAFTGATATRIGKFESADAGTIFLDEVSNIPLSIQAKLLRFLESRGFERVGGRKPIQASLRIIAATNRDLEAMAKNGLFRMDLFYRLNEFPIRLPPLRDRLEGIPYLVMRFLMKFSKEIGREVTEVAPEAMEVLRNYQYPGNVRELRNIVKRAMVVADKKITLSDLPDEVRGGGHRVPASTVPDINVPFAGKRSLPEAVRHQSQELEKQMILDALKKTGGHHRKAAELLGITTRTLYNKIKELGI